VQEYIFSEETIVQDKLKANKDDEMKTYNNEMLIHRKQSRKEWSVTHTRNENAKFT
jgi:hypothetical protein